MQAGTYKIVVTYMINKEGKVCEVFLLRSCEFSADLEILRVLEASPLWIPASLNGRNLSYRLRQNFVFEKSEAQGQVIVVP
jgi:hypothetical protein